ncbi:MAG: hypothetical protein U0T60_01040 [Buchnera aphidicola (Meitanaphis microgallis)]
MLDLFTLGEGFIADHLGKLLDIDRKEVTDYSISVGGVVIAHVNSSYSNPKMIALSMN